MIFATIRARILLGVAVPLLLLIFLGGMALVNIRTVVAANQGVNITHEVVIEAQAFLFALEGMESGARGYLLTGQEEFLPPYAEAKEAVFAQLAALTKRVAEYPEQLLRLREMENLIREWLREGLDPALALRRAGGGTEGPGAGRGQKYAERIRLLSDEFLAAEQQFNLGFEAKRDATVAATFTGVYVCVLAALLVGLLLAFWTAAALLRQVGGEPGEIARIAAEVAGGNLRVVFPGREKTGIVAALANMVLLLREQAAQIVEGANSLATALAQISATTSQFAASAGESSTTIAEVATTVEEVRHTAHLTTEKSQRMVTDAHRLAGVAREGGEAAAAALAGIGKINEEMEYIAECTIKLSEQTQNIGEIIGAVNELTDQSNLLSVNATIEAAKAGEVGKGFAVVAQEVKSLAEQAREATAQIKAILNELEKATGAAVMATERGSKAVEAGVGLSAIAGQAIAVFQESVDSFASAAELMGGSSRQQLAGMEQMVTAMATIKSSTLQNVQGARQLEETVRAIAAVGGKLQENVSRFKV